MANCNDCKDCKCGTKPKKVVGFFPMVGDILHTGHILALGEARANCDYLIVGLNCKPENKEPVQSIYERFIQLKAVTYVDEVIPYEGREDLELLASSIPYQVRFLGEDYLNKDWDGKEIEAKLNIRQHFLSRRHNMSSTNLKQRIRNG